MEQNQLEKQTLLPDRYPTKDFFIADVFDNLPFKDDIASMEHPMFTLSKKRDLRTLEYKYNDTLISIRPTTDGLPNIFDKDVLLYCASILLGQLNKGNVPSKTLRISSHDLLVATNRPTSGEGYTLLKKALDRLSGVKIKTNIKTNKRETTERFGLIDRYRIIESSRVKKRMVRLEITLSDWFYNSIVGREVLTINRDYFFLGKALERRLYEIARKHCGKSHEWSIGLGKLKSKTGSTSHLDKFRFFIREIEKEDHLPDYRLHLSKGDIVSFRPRKEFVGIEDLPSISPDTLEKGRRITEQAGTGWDFGELHSQFSQSLLSGFKPEKVDGAFIGFVRKKVHSRPN